MAVPKTPLLDIWHLAGLQGDESGDSAKAKGET
jgi:hypothetical protein